MGNTAASAAKGHTSVSTQPRTAADSDLLPMLRERFEELAGPSPPSEETGVAEGEQGQQQQQHQQHERFVLFGDCSELVGPRGAQVAARLYGVLDAGGDGKLDFEEFSSAACLLKGSPDEEKLKVLFKMYGDGSRGGLVGRVGLQAFILDIIAASPPPLAPLDRGRDGEVLCASPPPLASKAVLRRDGSKREAGSGETVTVTVDGGGGVEAPDFEVELADVLDRMAGVVLTEYDADSDGMLTEKEWMAYLRREKEAVNAFLNALSDSVGKLLLP